MQFMLLIYWSEDQNEGQSESERQALFAAYRQLTKEMVASGDFKYGDALLPTHQAKVVTVCEDEILIMDGPFVETKEQLGGVYLIECDTMDDAIAWAAKIPHVARGRVEVRPILHY